MSDVVTPEKRSRMMSGIRGRNTRPEVRIRKALHAKGFRFRIHDRRLPGKPDLVFPRYKAVILVHGCFWHGHDCHLFKWPQSNSAFWSEKIARNRMVDERTRLALDGPGWRVLEVWECALKGKTRRTDDALIEEIADWIRSSSRASGSVAGRNVEGATP